MDLTSWWPRPPSEDVVEELARLQRAEGVVPRPESAAADGPVLPPGVRPGGAFPRARGGGYGTAEVDSFLARAPGLSADEIRGTRFATTRSGGYDTEAVDAALARLAREAELRDA